MFEIVQAILNSSEKTDLRQLISDLRSQEKQNLLRNEILQIFGDYCQKFQKPAYFYHSSSLGKLIDYTHEIIFEEENIWFVIRTKIASQEVFRLTAVLTDVEPMSPQALLDLRDRIVNRYQPRILEIDLRPFSAFLPTIQDSRSIGKGSEFLNRYLCNELFTEPEYWQEKLFNTLHQVQYDGIPLLINDRIHSATQLSEQIEQALKFLSEQQSEAPYEKLRFGFQELGFEPGWGNTASRVRETLQILNRFINTPDPALLEAFVARIPTIFRVVLVSIHGWVAQENIGRPETMGQVAYVLDQARNLENQLWREIQLAGLDVLNIQPQVVILTRLIPNCEGTQCDLRREKIHGTHNAWILRVPFQEFNPEVTQNWIPKNEIWPYLETFAIDAETNLLAQLRGSPDLIIGNYSDGNLVAFLLARRLKATYCSIAHSLEKPKQLFSNLYWQELEEEYHFSLQFTADLITMNAADFIITSSYHEIVGSPETIGQYESYKYFTMPQLYHVVDGIELFSPKFNVVPPGVNQNIFFPYTEKDSRASGDRQRIHDLLFTQDDSQILGHLNDKSKRPIFTLTALNSIKNPSGLVECFGRNPALQERCNLIIVTNNLLAADTRNSDEAKEIERMHDLINEYQLDGHIRWIGMRLTQNDFGEVYRVVADREGIFVHSARFEAFGITLLEAMVSGLPTFATQFGGSLEIIQDGDNRFLINPMNLEETARKILDFIEECDANPQYWQKISEAAIKHIHEKYNWQFHIKQLLLCAKMESFWNYVYRDNREALLRYLEALFYLIYKPRAEKLLEQHMQR